MYTSIDMAHKIGEASASIGIDEEKECAADTLLRPINAQPPWKTIIVLDLDLYEKAYLLVHSRKDLRDRYVLCLGELHIIFAEIRAIGKFINSSGLDDAWMGANWFDSECLLQQVKQCPNMKRAIATHEATFIAISIVLLEATLLYFENQTLDIKNLFDCVQSARDAIDKLDRTSDKFREAWLQLNVLIGNIDLEVKINQFIDDHRGNRMLQFLVQYCNMVTQSLYVYRSNQIKELVTAPQCIGRHFS